jgi:putative DNA primase/helicase
MNSIRFNDLHLAARGRWDEILPALGVPSHALNRKAQPCPSCGGTDRFVYDNKFGRGNFICRSMEGNVSGDGFTLLVHTGVARSNYQALTLVAQYLGVTEVYNGY